MHWYHRREEEMPNHSWEWLPEGILREVINHMTPAAVQRFRLTCLHWRAVADRNLLVRGHHGLARATEWQQTAVRQRCPDWQLVVMWWQLGGSAQVVVLACINADLSLACVQTLCPSKARVHTILAQFPSLTALDLSGNVAAP